MPISAILCLLFRMAVELGTVVVGPVSVLVVLFVHMPMLMFEQFVRVLVAAGGAKVTRRKHKQHEADAVVE